MFYAALAATLFAAFKLSRAWGSTAALVFAALNGVVILLFPFGKLLGLALAGAVLYLAPGGRKDPPETSNEAQ